MRRIRDCNVCVVGGAGFLGSHLVHHLLKDRSCNVLVLDNLCAGHREFIPPEAKFLHADITGSEDYLTQVFADHAIEYVFNYAAYPYIPDSFERPLHVFNVNAFGALKVINAAHTAGCEGILQVSSAEIYGGFGDGNEKEPRGGTLGWRLSETTPIVPHSSYGASKAAIDAMVQVRWREAQTPVIALRQFNCLGERETHPYIIPEIISQLHAPSYNGTLSLGNNSTRDFLYAGDAVQMAVELLEKGEWGQVYNLGSTEATKIYDLAQRITNLVNRGEGDVEIKQDPKRVRPWEIWHLQSDNTKIYSVIGGRPKVGLTEALQWTIDDYIDNSHKWCWE